MEMKLNVVSVIIAFMLLASCSSQKSVTYMQKVEDIPVSQLQHSMAPVDPIVMPGDLIDIIVSGFNVDAVRPFNRHEFMSQVGTDGGLEANSPSYYLVDQNGDIDFPALGKLHIGGMNKAQIYSLLIDKLYPRYLSDKPSIDIRFKNFKVILLGEVKSPGVITADNERLNILEAIARAGDLTIHGERENVLLIRTDADGIRKVNRINLKDKNLILSPYYNLQQNDVIYVEPNSSKARESWSVPPVWSLVVGSLGTLMSIATFVIMLVDK